MTQPNGLQLVVVVLVAGAFGLLGCGDLDGQQSDEGAGSLIATAVDEDRPEPEGSADGAQSINAGEESSRATGIITAAEDQDGADDTGTDQAGDDTGTGDGTGSDGGGDGTDGGEGDGEPALTPVDPDAVDPSEPERTDEPAPVEEQEDPDDQPDEDTTGGARANVNYPSTELIDLGSGRTTDLGSVAAQSGRPVLLWFWSPASPSSAAEASIVKRLLNGQGDKVTVIAVGGDGDRAAADEFHANTGLGTTVLWSAGPAARDHYQVVRIPSTVLLAASGDVIARWNGLPEEAFSFVERMP